MILNDNQNRAVLAQNSVYLTACPGSGKTRTLTQKIIRELSNSTSSRLVIGITYTNKAADEIKIRIDESGISTKRLWLGTIHSFCLKWILKPYHSYVPALKYGFHLLNASAADRELEYCCHEYNKNSDTLMEPYDCKYYATKDGGFKLTNKYGSKNKDAASVLGIYFKRLSDNNQIDFEQILGYSLKILKNRPKIGKILSNMISWLFVDEFQDTKEIQYHIISSIIENQNTKLFIVGDPNQCIFSGLGGYPMSRSDLEILCKISLEQIELVKNYRSSTKIIEYGNYFQQIGGPVSPAGKNKNYPSIISHNRSVKGKDIVVEIARLIVLNIENYEIIPSEICVVAPQWIQLGTVTRSLMSLLPQYHFNGPGMMPFSKDIDNFWYKLCRIFLTDSHPNNYIRRKRWAREVLEELKEYGGNELIDDPRVLLRECNSIKREVNSDDGLKYLLQCFNLVCLKLNIELDHNPFLKEHLDSFIEATNFRLGKLRKEKVLGAEKLDFFIRCINPAKGITIATCHGVKGAEFDTVIAYSLLHDYIPHAKDKDGDVNSKKLLYVIASRAKKNLHLISEAGRFRKSNKKEYLPTQHLIDYRYDGYDTI